VWAPYECPPTASTRELLRGGLPAVYRDDELAMRFLFALEQVLDPIVATIDALPQHFDATYARSDVLDLLAAWVGVDLDESHTSEQRRAVVRRAAGLGRSRGTVRGLEEALALFFPSLPLRVEDRGGVYWGAAEPPEPNPEASDLIVSCHEPVHDEIKVALGRTIERFAPAHATVRLRVRVTPVPAG
jgi:phage tail-like protein